MVLAELSLIKSAVRLMYVRRKHPYIYIIFSRDLIADSLYPFMSGEASRSLSSALHEIETQSRLKEAGVFSSWLGRIDHVI